MTGDFAGCSAYNMYARTALEIPITLLNTSLTAPKNMLTVAIIVSKITARIIEIPVPSATQPIVEVEKLVVVIGLVRDSIETNLV